MEITMILVGYNLEENNNNYYYIINYNKEINLAPESNKITQNDMKKYFLNLQYDESLFNHINFFCENKNLKKCDIEINTKTKIYVFTANNKSKEELIIFFEKNGKKQLSNQINDIPEIIPEINNIPHLTNEELLQINNKSIELFQDSDFKKLVQIYVNKPHLLSIFYQYISSGNIIENNDLNIDVSKNLLIIQNLNLNLSDELITEALIKTGNHLNLSLRYLLFNNNLN